MKKIISILLVCAMLLSFGITATATETTNTDDTVIEQIERITKGDIETSVKAYQQQNEAAERWKAYTGVLYGKTQKTTQQASLKIAHDGDYLYLIPNGTTATDESGKTLETHIYLDLDGTRYQIVSSPNYGVYKDANSDNVNYYAGPGTSSRYDSGFEFYYRFGVFVDGEETTAYPETSGVAAEDALKYGIFCGVNYPGKKNWSTLGGGHEIVVPMPETIRSALGKGDDVTVQIGFTYLHNGDSEDYTTTGDEATTGTTDWRAWANSGSSNALVDVTLKGTAQDDNAQVPYNTTNSTLVGVQTNLATDAAEGTTYSARFVAALNTFDLANAKVYFRFVGNKATVNEQCNTVFNSITADGNNVPAWYLGADYLYCLKVNDLKLGTEYTFEIGAYCEGQDAVTMYTVTVDENGAITASPLAS